MKKRVLSLLLALALCAGLLPAAAPAAFAEGESVAMGAYVYSVPEFVAPTATELTFAFGQLYLKGYEGSAETVGVRLWKGVRTANDYDSSLDRYVSRVQLTAFVAEGTLTGVERQSGDGNYYDISGRCEIPTGSLAAHDSLVLEFYIKPLDTGRSAAWRSEIDGTGYVEADNREDGSFAVCAEHYAGGSSAACFVMGGIGHFDLTGAVYKQTMDSKETGDGGWVMFPRTRVGDGGTFYLVKSESATTHTFTMTTATITDPAGLSAAEAGAAVSGVHVTEEEDGIRTLSGTVTIPAEATSLTLRYGGAELASFVLDRTKLDPAAADGVYLTDAQIAGVNPDGTLTMTLGGLNLESRPASDYVLLTEEYADEEYRLLEAYVGRSLTGSGGSYTLLMDPDEGAVPPEEEDEESHPHERHAQFVLRREDGEYDYPGMIDAWGIENNPEGSMDDWLGGMPHLFLPDNPYAAGSVVRVEQNVLTATGTADIAVNAGKCEAMRWALSQEGLESAAWQSPVPSSVRVTVEAAPGSSQKVWFQFRTAEGTLVTRSTVVTVQTDESLPAPVNAGLYDVYTKKTPMRDADGTYLLYPVSYTLYAELPGGRDSARRIRATWGEYGSAWLEWNETNGRYEGTVSPGTDGTAGTFILRAEQLKADSTPHQALSLPWLVDGAPNVLDGTAPRVSSLYENGSYTIDPGASIYCSFIGNYDGYWGTIRGYARLNYTDENSEEKWVTETMSCWNGEYSGWIYVPEDAAALTSVIYYVQDDSLRMGRQLTYSLEEYRLSPSVSFSGFYGSYQNVTIELQKAGGDERFSARTDANGRAAIRHVDPASAEYTYLISGESGPIASGTLDASGSYTPASLGLPALYTLTADVQEGFWGVYPCFVRTLPGGGVLEIPMQSGQAISQLPAGAVGKMTATVYNDEVRALSLEGQEGLSVTVDGDTRVKLVPLPFESDTVTGTVYKPGDRPVQWVGLSLTQQLDLPAGEGGVRNARHIYRSAWAYTDGAGAFSIARPLADEAYTLRLSSANFKPFEFTGSGNSGVTVTLEYRENMTITPRLLVAPMKSSGDTLALPESVPGSSSLLVPGGLYQIGTDGQENWLGYSIENIGGGQERYYINDYSAALLHPGDRIRMYYYQPAADSGLIMKDTDEYERFAAEGVLNDELNATLEIHAQRLGGIRAVVVPESDPTDEIGYLLVYRRWGTYYSYYASELVGQAVGRGMLSVDNLPAGNYAAVTLRCTPEMADAVAAVIASGRLTSYANQQGSGPDSEVAVSGPLAVENGVYTEPAALRPAASVGQKLLGDYLLRGTGTQVGVDGTVQAKIWTEPLAEAGRPITRVELYRSSGTGDVNINGKTVAGEAVGGVSFVGSKTYYDKTTLSFSASEAVTSLRIAYLDKPADGAELASSFLRIYYDGMSGYEELMVDVSTNRFELSAPSKLTLTAEWDDAGKLLQHDDWTLPLTITASPQAAADGKDPNLITVYDNGAVVGTFRVTQLSTKATLELIRPGVWGLHELWATRPDVSSDDPNAVLTTAKCTVNVADPEKEINVNHLIWWHRNDRGKQQWEFERLSDIAGKTIRYYPAKCSAFAFCIANAGQEELENVRLTASYNGIPDYKQFRAEPITRQQFIQFWNKNAGTQVLSAESFEFGKEYSFWIVDALSCAEGPYYARSSDGSFDVDSEGFHLSYFSGFTVKFNYVGPAVELTKVALLPADAAYDDMTDEEFRAALETIDRADAELRSAGLDAYYRVTDAGGSLADFAEPELKARRDAVLAAADGSEQLRELLLSEVDALPASVRDSLLEKAGTAVQYLDSVPAAEREALGLNEADVIDGYSVNITTGDEAITGLESSRLLSKSVIRSEDHGLAPGDEEYLNTTDAARLDYVDPNSAAAVRWLMNYERGKKYNGTEEEKKQYENVSWTHYDSAQGTVYERYEFRYVENAEGHLDAEVCTTTYLPTAIVDAITVPGAGLMAESVKERKTIPTAQDTAVTRMDTVGKIHSTLDLVEDFREAASVERYCAELAPLSTARQFAAEERLVSSSFGTAMSVVGAGLAAYTISQGPQGKDESVLFDALSQIRDADVRAELAQDVLDYADRKGDLYLGESLGAAITSGGCFSPEPVSKTAAVVGGLVLSYRGSVAHAQLDDEFDAIVTRFNNQFFMQDMQDAYQGKLDAAKSALEERLIREGFSGSRLAEEMSKFELVRSAAGEFGYVPVGGWGQTVNDDLFRMGYVPEQPEPGKFDVDWGPSFGGKVPTEEELMAFYGVANIENARDALKNSPTAAQDAEKLGFEIVFRPVMSCVEEVPAFNLYIDPSGYVFEGVESDRVAGVEAALYVGDGSGSYALWEDANEDESERQSNPQLTAALDPDDADAGGRFGWMTPYGTWKVRFTDTREGYEREYAPAETKPMTVPPEHTMVNIGLISTRAPGLVYLDEAERLTGARAPQYSTSGALTVYADQMSVQFDKWMQLESIVNVAHQKADGSYPGEYSAITVTDPNGNLVPGTLSFPDRQANTGYKDGPYQTDVIGSDTFVRTAVFTPAESFTPGLTYTLTLSGSVRSYAGVEMSGYGSISESAAAPAVRAPLTPGGGSAMTVSDVLVGGASWDGAGLPAGNFRVELQLRLEGAPETVRVPVASYDANGRFLRLVFAALTPTETPTIYTAEASIGSGTKLVRAYLLSADGWQPLAPPAECK